MKRFWPADFTSALLTGAATGVANAQNSDRRFSPGTIIDLSYSFDSSAVYWPTAETFISKKISRVLLNKATTIRLTGIRWLSTVVPISMRQSILQKGETRQIKFGRTTHRTRDRS